MFSRSDKTNTSRRLRSTPTDAERALWHLLRRRQLDGYKFRRQFVIGSFIVDFVCLERRLVVEVDGGQHAEARTSYDAARTLWLQSRGFKVLRFWNNEALREVDGVLEVIRESLADAPC